MILLAYSSLIFFFSLLANIEGINTTEARRSALKMFDSSLELEIQWEGLAGSNLLGLCKEKLWVSQNEVPESVDR